MGILENYFPLDDDDADIGDDGTGNAMSAGFFGAQVPQGGFAFAT
jgi:hypothetical protein